MSDITLTVSEKRNKSKLTKPPRMVNNSEDANFPL